MSLPLTRVERTPTAEDEQTEIAYWIAIQDRRPLTARKIVEEIRRKAEFDAAPCSCNRRSPAFSGKPGF